MDNNLTRVSISARCLGHEEAWLHNLVSTSGIEITNDNPDELWFFAGAVNSTNRLQRFMDEAGEQIQKYHDTTVKIIGPLATGFLNSPEIQENPIVSEVQDFIEGRRVEDNFGASPCRSHICDDGSFDWTIQYGCGNHCSFCENSFRNIPKYNAFFDVIKECFDSDMLQYPNGDAVKLRIIGMNLNQYSTKDGYDLCNVVDYIENNDRINECELHGFSFKDAIKQPELIEKISTSHKINYIKGSLESGSDKLLKLISPKTEFTAQGFLNIVNQLQGGSNPKLELSIIAGFPGETMEDIMQTITILRKVRPHSVNICCFQTSPAPASKLPGQLDEYDIERHSRLYELALKEMGVNYCIVGIHE